MQAELRTLTGVCIPSQEHCQAAIVNAAASAEKRTPANHAKADSTSAPGTGDSTPCPSHTIGLDKSQRMHDILQHR